jgi:hypothetical protein
MDDISINIKLGSLGSRYGKIDFKLEIKSNMQGTLQLYAYDPTDLRKSGTLIYLDANGFSELKLMIEKIQNTIDRLENSNQMKGMEVNKY